MPSASLVSDAISFTRAGASDEGAGRDADASYGELPNSLAPSSLEHVRSSDAFPKLRPLRVSSLGELEPPAVGPMGPGVFPHSSTIVPVVAGLLSSSSALVASGLRATTPGVNGDHQTPLSVNGERDETTENGESNGGGAVTELELQPIGADRPTDANATAKQPCCPFRLLPGESVYRYGPMEGGQLYLTTYRLFVHFQPGRGFYNVPLMLIDGVEIRELCGLQVTCKDGQILRISSESSEKSLIWYKELTAVAVTARSLEKIFAFPFHAWCTDERQHSTVGIRAPPARPADTDLLPEFQRLRLDEALWRVSTANKQFEVCDSYPRLLIVPASVNDQEIVKCGNARYLKRFPAVSWRHPVTEAILLRSSQPALGLFGWRNSQDEALLRSYLLATVPRKRTSAGGETVPNGLSSTSVANQLLSEQAALDSVKPMLILDARSYAAAWANRAKGGGFENPEYYQKCELQFLGLANIHNIRYSFQQLRLLLASTTQQNSADQANWLQTLQTTQWLQYAGALLAASVRCADALHTEGRTVLIHCSDGWDRTTQIVSLTKLMLDPYYRTMRGFQELVEREWVEFGHKFSDRHGLLNGDPNERSPVFLQWLDCVHQMYSQRPTAFEFNHLCLIKLAQHAYAGLFGTFLCNSVKEREKNGVSARTFSVWSYLHADNLQFRNVVFEPFDGPIRPACQLHQLRLWTEMYLTSSAAGAPPGGTSPPGPGVGAPDQAAAPVQMATAAAASSGAQVAQPLTKAHSCDSLQSLDGSATTTAAPCTVGGGRTGSESNLMTSSSCTGFLPPPPPDTTLRRNCGVTACGAKDSNAAAAIREEESVCETVGRVCLSDSDDAGTTCDSVAPTAADNNNVSPPIMVKNGDLAGSERRGVDRSLDFLDMCESFSVCPLPADGDKGTGGGGGAVSFSPSSLEKALTGASAPITGAGYHMDTSTSEISDSLVSRPRIHVVKPSRRVPSAVGQKEGQVPSSCVYWRERARRKRREGSIQHCIDTDGLTYFEDEQQERMRDLREQDMKRCELLEMEVQRLRFVVREKQMLIDCQKCGNNGFSVLDRKDLCDEDVAGMSMDSNGGGGGWAGGGCGASDVSWEAVEERDTQPTKWIPDHAVSHCMGCDAAFWTINRKHHCRRCGKVFCSECSRYEATVPDEQLYRPVRVCDACFGDLQRIRRSSSSTSSSCITASASTSAIVVSGN